MARGQEKGGRRFQEAGLQGPALGLPEAGVEPAGRGGLGGQ